MDMKKAFDSVSHQSILVAATCLGIPPPFLGYLRELYSNAQPRLKRTDQGGAGEGGESDNETR